MTISTTANVQTFVGDNSTTEFDYTKLFYANGDLLVTVNGVTKVLDTDYTVTGAGDANGGTITFTTAPAQDANIVVQRIVDYIQDTDLENFDGNPADVTEKQFDLCVMQAQQLADASSRSLKIPAGESTTVELTSASSRANKAAVFDASGNLTVSTDDYEDQAADAAASATAAANSATSASSSASSASTSASNASSSASDAAASATAASNLVSDGDKGDITLSSSGTVWTVDADAITYDKMQDTTGTDVILGRSTAGAGTIEEITCTSAGRDLLDDASATAQRTTLGLGALSTLDTVDTSQIDNDAIDSDKISKDAINGHTSGTVAAGDSFVFSDVDDTGNLKTDTVQGILDLVSGGGVTLGTATATTSGTAINYTSIPSGTKRITINLTDVSVSGTSNITFRLGDSGGIETSGYLGAASTFSASAIATANHTTGCTVNGTGAAIKYSGTIIMTLIDSSANTWAIIGSIGNSAGTATGFLAYSKSLSAELDRIQMTTTGGTDTFDFGTVNITYEG
jgi:hypothetical protein